MQMGRLEAGDGAAISRCLTTFFPQEVGKHCEIGERSGDLEPIQHTWILPSSSHGQFFLQQNTID